MPEVAQVAIILSKTTKGCLRQSRHGSDGRVKIGRQDETINRIFVTIGNGATAIENG